VVWNGLRGLRNEDGQSVVELAFVMPLVLLFLFGIIDFGLALNAQNSDTNVANLAVRTASVVGNSNPKCQGTTEASLTAWVRCMAAATGAPTPSYVCVADISGGTPSANFVTGDAMKVEVQSNFSWLKMITKRVAGLQSTIGASATMRIEQPPATGNTFLSSPGTPTCPT
jgi:Flp pilus assembly protein TadG